jgi:hypothetical protein
MNRIFFPILALVLWTPGFAEAARPGEVDVPPAPERKRMVETQLDRCDLGQPERFSEPP